MTGDIMMVHKFQQTGFFFIIMLTGPENFAKLLNQQFNLGQRAG